MRRRLRRAFELTALVLAAGLLPFVSAGAQEAGPTTLLSYTLVAQAAPVYETYHQPSAPIPATPTQEFSLGHSQIALESGSGRALASAVWPGSTAANAPSALHDVDPNFPLLPNYPVRAEAFFPASEGQQSATSLDAGAYAMRAEVGATEALASARSSEVEGSLQTGAVSSRTTGLVEGDTATTVAGSSLSDINLLDGLVVAEGVTSRAEATSDGETAKLSGRTVVTGLTIQGVDVTVDSEGVHLVDEDVPVPLGDATGSLNESLVAAGLSIFVAEPIDLVEGATASRSLGGLIITINPQVLAQNLPPEVIGQVPPQVPGFLTTFDQTFTIALGGVAVKASASPPFVPPPLPPPPPAGDGGDGGAGLPPGPSVAPPPGGPTVEPQPSPASGSEAPSGASLPMAAIVAGLVVAAVGSRGLRVVADRALFGAPAAAACPLEER